MLDETNKKLLKLLIALAWADGRVDEEEMEVVEAMLDTFEADKQMAEELREWAKTQRSLILVAGHTDSDGVADYNQQLSQMRAQAVSDVLISGGVPGETITIRGYGETQPIASNETRDGKTQNRRVEFVIED